MLDNHFIKLELLQKFARNQTIDLLEILLKIQKDMGDSIRDYSHSRNAIEVYHIVQKQAQKASTCPPCEQQPANRFLNDPRNNNPILCYFCSETSHKINNGFHIKNSKMV